MLQVKLKLFSIHVVENGWKMPSDTTIGVCKNNLKELFFIATSYSTVRLAKVQSIQVALIFRLIQLVIIGYIIGWERKKVLFSFRIREMVNSFVLSKTRYTIIYEKGYQQLDSVSSAVTTKVKGLGYLFLDEEKILKLKDQMFFISTVNENNTRIFDVARFFFLKISH